MTNAMRAMAGRCLLVVPIFVLMAFTSACGGGSADSAVPAGAAQSPSPEPSPDPAPDPAPPPYEPPDYGQVFCSDPDVGALATLDAALCSVIEENGLSGNPASGLAIPEVTDPLARLGKHLFFSQGLSIRGDVACASCHQPVPPFFGGDGLSLPVGTSPHDSRAVGLARTHDDVLAAAAGDPFADAGPNVPRRSLSTFNSVLYRDALFYDGRLRWAREEAFDGIDGIISPEGRQYELDSTVNTDAPFPLLQAQARLPVTSAAEMQGFGTLRGLIPAQVRGYIADRFAGVGPAGDDLPVNDWSELFQAAYGPDFDVASVNFEHIAEALAAYQASQLFIDNPWFAYVRGDLSALTEGQKRGALLFYLPVKDGGAGCASCHSGDLFSDESFHVTAMPQIGRGKGQGKHAQDAGFALAPWRSDQDLYAFRTTSLLNVAAQSTFGHAGAFSTLREVIEHHTDAAQSLSGWSLAGLPQFAGFPLDFYADADAHSAEALTALEQQRASGKQPVLENVSLTSTQLDELEAFLAALVDWRIAEGDSAYFSPWLPEVDPDGCQWGKTCQLEFDEPFPKNPEVAFGSTGPVVVPDPDNYALDVDTGAYVRLVGSGLAENCPAGTSAPAGDYLFVESAGDAGLDQVVYTIDYPNIPELDNYRELFWSAGGVAAADLDQDCDIDLLIADSGDGPELFSNTPEGFSPVEVAGLSGIEGNYASAHFADLSGDGLFDLVLPGLLGSSTKLFVGTGPAGYEDVSGSSGLDLLGGMYSVSSGDYDLDGRLDLWTTWWANVAGGVRDSLWKNMGDMGFAGATDETGLRDQLTKEWTFVGNFRDMNGDVWPDLLSVADFRQTQVFRNEAGAFVNVTGASEINDRNGMGTAFLDVNEDGWLDWFVSAIAIFDRGNRLYINSAVQEEGPVFSEVGDEAGVRLGGWAWSSCAEDFSLDGFQEIFHTNGWPEPDNELIALLYQGERPRLFHRASPSAESGFEDVAALEAAGHAGLLPGDGRGVVCADFNRDGAVDILVINHEEPVHLYLNRARALFPERQFLTVRLRNQGENWAGIGARISITVDGRTQTRIIGGDNYLSQNPAEAHFGLGTAAVIDEIRVDWPPLSSEGRIYQDVSVFTDVDGGRILDIIHPGCSLNCAPASP